MGPRPDTALRGALARTRKKTAPTQSERRAFALAGLEKSAVRCDKNGEAEAAQKIRAFADKATPFFTDVADLEKTLAQPLPDVLGDAYAKAAKELKKALPACFPCAADALHFARRLNMSEATAEATRLANERQRVNKLRHVADGKFWEEIQKAANAIFPSDDGSISINSLLKAGQ